MPTFDFQCTKCDHVFEFARPFGSKTVPACPACKSKKTEKLMTPPTIQFKGTGFYKTDSAKKSGSPTQSVESKPKSDAPAPPKTDANKNDPAPPPPPKTP
jgi:putative FmdB family regulatory protein